MHSDIKKVLNKLDIKDAVLGGFSMGGAIAVRYAAGIMEPMFQNWLYLEQQPRSGLNVMIFHTIFQKCG
jgi:pimeloyl-ACP methyl ester carboxylesterase